MITTLVWALSRPHLFVLVSSCVVSTVTCFYTLTCHESQTKSLTAMKHALVLHHVRVSVLQREHSLCVHSLSTGFWVLWTLDLIYISGLNESGPRTQSAGQQIL